MKEIIKKLLHHSSDSNKIAIINRDSNQITYQDLLTKAHSLAKYIESQNVLKGDRVCIEIKDRLDFLIAFLSGIFSQYCVVPINYTIPQQDIDYIKEVVNAKLELKSIPLLKNSSWNETKKTLEKNDLSGLGIIFFTSGTTNRPKGVCHSFSNFLMNAQSFNKRVNHDQNIKMLNLLPIGYVAGLLNTFMCPLLAGGTIILSDLFSPFSASSVLDLATKHSANSMWLSPTMAAFFSRIKLTSKVQEWSRNILKNVHIGTGPLNLVQKESFEKVFSIKCLESFGMSEILLASANSHADTYKLLSAGKTIEGTIFKAQNKNETLDPGEEGELLVKSKYMMLGYWNEDLQKPNPLDSQWFNTGDIGIIDTDNYLFITGRSKDLIIKGGVNFSPRAIEEVLLECPDINDVAVVGAKHVFWGEEIVAFIIPNNEANSSKIKAFCDNRLAKDAVPSKFIFVKEFPRTTTGKIQKAKLRKQLEPEKN